MTPATRVRVLAWTMLAGGAASVLLLQHALRPWLRAHGHADAPLVGWLPNLLTTAALSYLWIAVLPRRPIPSLRTFLIHCLGALIIVVNHELWQIRDPSHRFDPADVVASLVGAALAFAAFRVAVREARAAS